MENGLLLKVLQENSDIKTNSGSISLRWDTHINYIVGKANGVLGLIRRTFGS